MTNDLFGNPPPPEYVKYASKPVAERHVLKLKHSVGAGKFCTARGLDPRTALLYCGIVFTADAYLYGGEYERPVPWFRVGRTDGKPFFDGSAKGRYLIEAPATIFENPPEREQKAERRQQKPGA